MGPRAAAHGQHQVLRLWQSRPTTPPPSSCKDAITHRQCCQACSVGRHALLPLELQATQIVALRLHAVPQVPAGVPPATATAAQARLGNSRHWDQANVGPARLNSGCTRPAQPRSAHRRIRLGALGLSIHWSGLPVAFAWSRHGWTRCSCASVCGSKMLEPPGPGMHAQFDTTNAGGCTGTAGSAAAAQVPK
jgi:hypothetical protein